MAVDIDEKNNNQLSLEIYKVLSINTLVLIEQIKKSKYSLTLNLIAELGRAQSEYDIPSLIRMKIERWTSFLEDYNYRDGPQFYKIDYTNLID